VQQNGAPARIVKPRYFGASEGFNKKRVLGNREDVRALGLAVPARHAGEPVCDIFDLHIERGGIKEIEAAAGQHALPSARRLGARP
jgi:hypothetical protein